METYEVASSAAQGKKLIVAFKECNNINQVLHLVGQEFYITREQLPELSEGEHYWRDLLEQAGVDETAAFNTPDRFHSTP